MSEFTEFVSYATDYDLYTGRRGIGDLPADQQDALIRAALAPTDEFRELVVAKQVRKSQAEGLWKLVVVAGLALERLGLVKDFDRRTDAEIQEIVGFFSGTLLWLRLEEAFPPFDIRSEKTPYDWSELEDSDVLDALDVPDERPHIAKQQICELLTRTPEINLQYIDRLPYQSFKHFYDEGKLMLVVDRGLAPVAARARVVRVPWSATLAIVFFVGLLAILPLWIFAGFWYALTALGAAVIAKRITMRMLVSGTRRVAIANKNAYRWLVARRIIWFRYVAER